MYHLFNLLILLIIRILLILNITLIYPLATSLIIGCLSLISYLRIIGYLLFRRNLDHKPPIFIFINLLISLVVKHHFINFHLSPHFTLPPLLHFILNHLPYCH